MRRLAGLAALTAGSVALVEGVRRLSGIEETQTRLGLVVVGFATAFELVVLAWSASRRGITDAVVAGVVGGAVGRRQVARQPEVDVDLHARLADGQHDGGALHVVELGGHPSQRHPARGDQGVDGRPQVAASDSMNGAGETSSARGMTARQPRLSLVLPSRSAVRASRAPRSLSP